jgi:arylsulfatase A-like enzyme
MNRRSFLRSVCGGALMLGMGEGCTEAREEKGHGKGKTKPNIILIISDDAGYADFGFTGGEQIPTPHLDKMAKEGVNFTQGYVTASVCCPSRMGLMTGRYQQRFGAECNVPTIPTPGFTKEDLGLEPTERTMADGLREAGYRTMMIGKWHLGELAPYHPLKRGFDEFYGFLGGSRSYWPLEKPGRGHAILRNNQPVNEEEEIKYLTDDLTDAALEFIDRNKQNPFFVFLSYNAVHTPMHAKEEDIEQFTEISPKNRRIYAAMTKSMDENIGKVTKKLEEQGLAKDTLIIFINDNGGPKGNSSNNKPLRGTKGTYWEGGIRVPFTVKWPGQVPTGKKYDYPVSTLDLLPTVLAAAGGKHVGKELDGVNLLPYMCGEKSDAPHEYLFWRLWRAAAVRKGPWKLIRVAGDPLEEKRELLLPLMLFNIEDDPSETKNVADEHPELVKELCAALEKWEKGLGRPRWYDGSNWQHWANEQIKNHSM